MRDSAAASHTASRPAVKTSTSTPTGSYTVTITGTNGALSHAATAALQVKRK